MPMPCAINCGLRLLLCVCFPWYDASYCPWNWLPPVVRKRWKGCQLVFVLYEAHRRPGVPARVANAHARFEYEARQALRDWLMV